jgi:hypothetical protein
MLWRYPVGGGFGCIPSTAGIKKTPPEARRLPTAQIFHPETRVPGRDQTNERPKETARGRPCLLQEVIDRSGVAVRPVAEQPSGFRVALRAAVLFLALAVLVDFFSHVDGRPSATFAVSEGVCVTHISVVL